MRKAFEIGGLVAAAVLIAFGVAAIAMGFSGRSTVNDSLKQEAIVGTPDMTKDAIAAEAKKAGLPASVELPTANIASKAITNGTLARDFAKYMRIHTLEATGGQVYAEMAATSTRLASRPATRSRPRSIPSRRSRSRTRCAPSGSTRRRSARRSTRATSPRTSPCSRWSWASPCCWPGSGSWSSPSTSCAPAHLASRRRHQPPRTAVIAG
jgi:hypothetical protein